MPLNLTILEEIDIVTEIESPEFIYSIDSLTEQVAFSKYINLLSGKRILLLNSRLFNIPFMVASLKEHHIETILKEEALIMKNYIMINLSNPDFLKQVFEFINEIDRREKTTENSTQFKNILQYLRDNKSVI